MGNVLAIDQGTSGTTALVVCVERGVIGSGHAPVHPRYGAAGSVEVDPLALLASVMDAGRQALADAGEPVLALGLANQGETVLAWDRRTGEPLTDALVWQDQRAASICAEAAATGTGTPERITALTGLPLDPYFAAPKMAWIRRHLTTEGVVTTSDAWLVHRLTGAFVTDASTASRTLLLDLDEVAWCEEALAMFGLLGEDLPQVVDAAGDFGRTHAFDEHLPGGSGGLPLTGLLVDQQAALLAQRCLTAGPAKCTFGTGAFLLANTGTSPRRSATGLATCLAWRLDGTPSYCLDGQVFAVGSAVRWLTELGVIIDATDLDRVGAQAPDTGGVTFVPALAGLAAPWWRGDVRAQISGLGLNSGPAHLVRALCEGIAASVVELADATAADIGMPLTSLRVDGGLTRSRVLMQTQADLLQLPVEVYPSPDATALGVAAAARLGARFVGTGEPGLTPEEAVGNWRPSVIFEPTITPDEAAGRLGTFRAAVAALISGVP